MKSVLSVLLCLFAGAAIAFCSFHFGTAFADTPAPDESPTIAHPYRPLFADAGSATATSSPTTSSSTSTPATTTPTPADQLHNPVTDPVAAFDDARAARKIGWPMLVLVASILLLKTIGTLGVRLAWLAWLNKGRTAVVIAGLGTLLAAAFNALALGGTWFAAATAAASAGFAIMFPSSPPPKPAES